MHNAAFRHLGLDCVYVPFKVSSRSLRDAVRGLRLLGVKGFNVTVPHKVEIVKHLQKIDPITRAIGAVNTVLNDSGTLVGYNTDATGAIEALKSNGVSPGDSKFTILGAGGAASAIIFSVAEASPRVTVLNRTLEKAEKLKRKIKRQLQVDIWTKRLTRRNLVESLRTCDVLVNATSVGMEGNPSGLPIRRADLERRLTVFDIVYGRSETELLRKARSAGCKTISGVEMLLHQGAAAFEIWTGRKAPVEVMRRALAEATARGVRGNAGC
jgi:shikimate dehydrogenase